jgi:hypothetical protein
VPANKREQSIARLGKSWKSFERVKSGGEAPSVALARPIVERLSGGLDMSSSRNGLVC